MPLLFQNLPSLLAQRKLNASRECKQALVTSHQHVSCETRAQIECQSYRLIVEDSVTVEYITRYVAELKQKYTQNNGRRPYGISCLIGGFDCDGGPHLFQTEPSGTYYEWKAGAIGRGEKAVRDFLEKNYSAALVATEKGAVKLAIMSLLEVVYYGQKNLDVFVLRKSQPTVNLDQEEIKEYFVEIEKEKEDKAAQ
ncbi:unnamed protein product [Parnassius apollo]|uniref:(apollo) hypothetical protein n=1 Tax=Parnassius apollo TaxID=110799 RepID=A0A8S3Y046_PARAO|nr:unnamed protein product [Parnassius apollo]